MAELLLKGIAMDQNMRFAMGGLISILLGLVCLVTFFNPGANSATRAFDAMFRAMTFPRSLSPRVVCLLGGLVGIMLGVVALADALDIVRLPRR